MTWSGAGGAWRLLRHGAASGAWNMAVDEALLEACAASGAPATLRIYSWARPTLSLGRFQDIGDVDLDVCAREGVDLVKRATGGRAVLHHREVTYSVTAARTHGLPRSVARSYRILCGALLAAYGRLGVRAEVTAGRRGERSSACYLQTTPADLSLGYAKLSGSAQVWREDACLQHGSVVLSRDVRLEADLLRLGDEGASRLKRSTVGLEDVLGGPVSAEDVEEALIRGFEDSLGVTLKGGRMSQTELEAARRLEGELALNAQRRQQG